MFNNSLHGQILESIFNLSILQALSLIDNSNSGNLPSSLANGLPNLECVLVGGNQLSGEISASISKFSKLTKLGLDGNSFSGRVPMNLGNSHNLQFIDFGFNHLTKDPLVLKMENNYFDIILPKSLGNSSKSVENFEADHCDFKGIIPNEIGILSNLIELDIGSNELTRRITDILDQLRKLQKLMLGFNKLRGSVSANL